MIIFIYVVLVFLILRFSVTIFNFLSNPKLGKYGKHFSDKVAIIINSLPGDADNGPLLQSIRDQDYQEVEIVVCPADHMEMIQEAAQNADYLLFLSPDTVISNGFINSLLYRTKVFDLALLSIIPREIPSGFAAHCILPLNDFVLLNLVPLRLVRLLPGQAFAVASDKCMFFNAALYRNHGWHAGREVMKTVKAENYKVETLLGNRLITVPADPDKKKLLTAAGNNLLLHFGNNPVAAILYLILVVGGPVFMLANYEYALLIMPVGLIFLSRVMISFLAGQHPLLNILLHPIQMIVLFISMLRAIFIRIFM